LLLASSSCVLLLWFFGQQGEKLGSGGLFWFVLGSLFLVGEGLVSDVDHHCLVASPGEDWTFFFFSYRTTVSTKTEEKHSNEAKAVPTTAVEPIADRG
jgi:hypothetical protein